MSVKAQLAAAFPDFTPEWDSNSAYVPPVCDPTLRTECG